MIKTKKRLLEIYDEWEDKLDKDEWYFDNAFELITKEMSSAKAYDFIPNVIEALFQLDNDFLIWQTLYFLIELYCLADTTEIHPLLESNWSVLTKHIKKYEDSFTTPFNELKRQLRITQ